MSTEYDHEYFAASLNEELEAVRVMLLEKNKLYGNSALEPLNVFAKGSPVDGINWRIDDKLKRIRNGALDDSEDPELDLIGYLLLRRIARSVTP